MSQRIPYLVLVAVMALFFALGILVALEEVSVEWLYGIAGAGTILSLALAAVLYLLGVRPPGQRRTR